MEKTIIALFLAGICFAIMDTLAYHFKISVFKNLNETYWNPDLSWRNKYKLRIPTKGEKFPFSTTILVFLTDAWHFFQFVGYSCIILAIIFYEPISHPIVDFLLLKTVLTTTKHIFYKKILA
jgi:hypothetical protein